MVFLGSTASGAALAGRVARRFTISATEISFAAVILCEYVSVRWGKIPVDRCRQSVAKTRVLNRNLEWSRRQRGGTLNVFEVGTDDAEGYAVFACGSYPRAFAGP
jgi:hypothetical protein